MKIDCIAMAYENEPLERIAVGKRDSVTYILKPSLWNANGTAAHCAVGFPEWAVFEFDAALFADLRAAYERNDSDTLARLWEGARPLSREALPEIL